MVMEVALGSDAGRLGIQKGDVILAVNGQPVFHTDEFQRLLCELGAGPARFTVNRFGHINEFVIDIH